MCFSLQIVPSPPSNLSATQSSLDSVFVSWSMSHGVDGYTIFWFNQEEGPGRRHSRSIDADRTSFTLPRLIAGKTYSISMIAFTGLHSTETAPVNITIGR